MADAYGHHGQWREIQEKAVNQLLSMSNLADQLEALRRCRIARNGLGCLNTYTQLSNLLEGKIFTSFERALGFVHNHTENLEQVCKNLKCHWKESTRLLTDIVESQGDERALNSDEESFSMADVTEWLRLMYAAHVHDLSEKQTALSDLTCSSTVMEKVCAVWTRDPTNQLTEILLDSIRYTVEQFKISENCNR